MLTAAGVAHQVRTGGGDEDAAKCRFRDEGLGARDLALALAAFKAGDAPADPGDLVIGADQTLECADGSMLDKPASRADAAAQLRLLSGRDHRLHSAAVVVEAGQIVWSAAETVTLSVRPLSDSFIAAYVAAEYERIRFSVGGYQIEGAGVQLFDQVEGSHFAILGLPLLPLLGYLRERGALPS
jgi:septum formation protein